jgi:NAD(P)-dependent dehydrogenase (short-subunit alcohol dehydrogenase family)
MNSTKKLAVVTGANPGLGFEASRQLAKNGYHVISPVEMKPKVKR